MSTHALAWKPDDREEIRNSSRSWLISEHSGSPVVQELHLSLTLHQLISGYISVLFTLNVKEQLERNKNAAIKCKCTCFKRWLHILSHTIYFLREVRIYGLGGFTTHLRMTGRGGWRLITHKHVKSPQLSREKAAKYPVTLTLRLRAFKEIR